LLPESRPRLTSSEAISLADIKAREQGVSLDDYQRPQAHYTLADETWTVTYDHKSVDGTGAPGKYLTVTIDEKSKKTSVTPGK
jgi:hypothetical protein